MLCPTLKRATDVTALGVQNVVTGALALVDLIAIQQIELQCLVAAPLSGPIKTLVWIDTMFRPGARREHRNETEGR